MIQILNILVACFSLIVLTGCEREPLEYQYLGQTQSTLPFNPMSFWTTADADVSYDEKTESVIITGPITDDTLIKFTSFSDKNIKNVIIASPGGLLLPSIKIAKFIAYKNIDTIIPNKGMCYSACTLIFQAGNNRFAFANSMLMYHSAKNETALTNNPIPSESATVLFWAYLVIFGIDDSFFDGMDLSTDYFISPERSMKYNIVTHLIPVDNSFKIK